MRKKVNNLALLGLVLGSPLFFPVSCTVSGTIIGGMMVEEDARNIDQGDQPHQQLKVLVTDASEEITIVDYADIDALVISDQNYSLELPKKQAEFSQGRWVHVQYSVTNYGNSDQLVEVSYADDDVSSLSRYRVENGKVVPVYSKVFHPSIVYRVFLFAVIFASAVFFVGRRLRKHGNRVGVNK